MSSYKIKIRFNKDHAFNPGMYWRVLIDNLEEILVNSIEIKVESKTIQHTENGVEKWSIYCEANDWTLYKVENKLVIS